MPDAPDAAPAALREGIARAVRDLDPAHDALCDVDAVERDRGQWLVVARFADFAAGNVVTVEATSGEQITAQVADVLQQAFIEHAREARPLCPGHTHPMRAAVDAGRAVWVCPVEEATVIPIGEFAARREP